MSGFGARSDETEYMDAFDCDPERLRRTLEQFTWSNRLLTRYRTLLTRWVLDDMARTPDRERVLLDLGCGGGDIPAWLAGRARKRGLRLSIVAVDSHPEVIAFARERLKAFPEIKCREGNALDLDRWMPCDYVFGNHFLHHLRGEEILRLLRRLCESPVRRFLFDDLLRSRASWIAYSVAARLLFPDSFALHDGLLSIRRGFIPSELIRPVRDAGLGVSIRVLRMWPRRVVLIGQGFSS